MTGFIFMVKWPSISRTIYKFDNLNTLTMNDMKILVPTDFTTASMNAAEHAGVMSSGKSDLTLLHIKNNHTRKLLENVGESSENLNNYISQLASDLCNKHQVACSEMVVEGSIFEDINDIAEKQGFSVIVIGTHGTKGLRQTLFGGDILKIARKAPVPILVVPEDHIIGEGYKKIILPFGGHESFMNISNAVANVAARFNSEVHIFSVDRPGEKPSAQMKSNIENTKALFDERQINYKEIHQDPEIFSTGFAKQTLKYAADVNADIIAAMSISTEQYAYISNNDKELLLNNDHGISVLMTANY